MTEQEQICRFLWEKTSDKSAKILRVFSNLPVAVIPAQIDGYSVKELGNYCFAPSGQITEHAITTKTPVPVSTLTELCGNYLNAVYLPESVEKIGDYTFYNCRNLTEITLSDGLYSVGSDAFMNCHHMRRIHLKCSPSKKNCLRQILSQISWDVEAVFYKHTSSDSSQKEAVVFFPEYYESYDEIAPAHVFGRSIIGEGFRARQCFQDDILDFPQYDKIFPKACVEESGQTLCQMAFYRLRYPYQMSDTDGLRYTDYLVKHGLSLCRQFISNKNLDDLLFLFQEKLLSLQNIQQAISLAAQAGWSEGSAAMLRWKQLHMQTFSEKRYQLDDF